MAAKPILFLELHYTMIQFLINMSKADKTFFYFFLFIAAFAIKCRYCSSDISMEACDSKANDYYPCGNSHDRCCTQSLIFKFGPFTTKSYSKGCSIESDCNFGSDENDVLFSNDTGILGKRNSEFSQQESNLRPSDYYLGRSTTELQETRGS